MISAATAMPMPETGPSLSRNWMKANVIAAAIFLATVILMNATDKLLGLDESTTGMLFRGIGSVIAFFGAVVPLVAYAMLTGPVLSEKLPAFSRRGWISLHASIGVVLGVAFAAVTLFGSKSSGAPATVPSHQTMLIGGLVATFVFGPMFGAIMGGLQTLVLRRAATGMLAWVLWSAAGSTVLAGGLDGAPPSAIGQDNGVATFLAIQAVAFAGMVGSAVIMLPAAEAARTARLTD